MRREITIVDVWKMLGSGKKGANVNGNGRTRSTERELSYCSTQLKVEVLNKHLGREME